MPIQVVRLMLPVEVYMPCNSIANRNSYRKEDQVGDSIAIRILRQLAKVHQIPFNHYSSQADKGGIMTFHRLTHFIEKRLGTVKVSDNHSRTLFVFLCAFFMSAGEIKQNLRLRNCQIFGIDIQWNRNMIVALGIVCDTLPLLQHFCGDHLGELHHSSISHWSSLSLFE